MHALLDEFRKYSWTVGDTLCHVYDNTSVQLNVEYTKCCKLYCGNVEGGIGQDPATEITHLGLNQFPVFQCYLFVFIKEFCACIIPQNRTVYVLPRYL